MTFTGICAHVVEFDADRTVAEPDYSNCCNAGDIGGAKETTCNGGEHRHCTLSR